MIIEIDLESDTPIYLQLRNEIIRGVASGELEPGESLPSVRSLGSDLGINMHTVSKAYNLLKNESIITIHKQKGVIVKQLNEMKNDEASLRIASQLTPIIAEAICRSVSVSEISGICKKVYNEVKKGE